MDRDGTVHTMVVGYCYQTLPTLCGAGCTCDEPLAESHVDAPRTCACATGCRVGQGWNLAMMEKAGGG